MGTFFSKLSKYFGQTEPEKLKEHLTAVDKDLENLFNGVFLFNQQNVLKLDNRTGLPSSTAYVGYICVTSGKVYVCTVSGTPGTWTVIGSQS